MLVDAPTTTLGSLASRLAAQGIHVSFALSHLPPVSQLGFLRLGDQCVPRLPGGGLVRWIGTSSQLHRWSRSAG